MNTTGRGRGLQPLKDKIPKKRIVAFDIETAGEHNEFVMGSLAWVDKGFNRYCDEYERIEVFWDKHEMIEYILSQDFFYNQCAIVATNLQFDLLALFEDTEYFPDVKFMFRGSRLLMGTYRNIDRKQKEGRQYTINFYDTMNHLRASVKRLGELVDTPKLQRPEWLGEYPDTEAKKEYLEKYNKRDSLITLRFTRWLQQQYNDIGCSFRVTLPSTSMDLFRRRYLDTPIQQPSKEIMRKQYKAYYGGRTEAIKRGKIQNAYLYDINSLYPSAMRGRQFPNPNHCYHRKGDVEKQIKDYEGVSKVKMWCPEDLNIPYLPVKHEEKLKFPAGLIKGWYTHFEIRRALELGYELLESYETIYYTKTHDIFTEYVEDMYNARMEHKGTRIELSYKLLMNSLYGKFAQSIEPEPEVHHINGFKDGEFIEKWNDPNVSMEVVNDFVILKKDEMQKIPKYINPIYSIYITAYARTILYNQLPDDVYYMDTDSCITHTEIETGEELGEWDKEAEIRDGIIVKPKFYMYNDTVKVKGCYGMDTDTFKEMMEQREYADDRKEVVTPEYRYDKVTKFKESMRNDIPFNTNSEMVKRLGVEDDKRDWYGKQFSHEEKQESKPLVLTENDYNE